MCIMDYHNCLCYFIFFYVLKVTEADNLNLFQNSAKLKIYGNSLRYVNGLMLSYFCKEGKYAG